MLHRISLTSCSVLLLCSVFARSPEVVAVGAKDQDLDQDLDLGLDLGLDQGLDLVKGRVMGLALHRSVQRIRSRRSLRWVVLVCYGIALLMFCVSVCVCE